MLREAKELINTMPMDQMLPRGVTLLGACKKYGDKEMGEKIGRELIELQPEHDVFHLLLSNIYASKGNWSNVQELRGIMKSGKAWLKLWDANRRIEL
ncbi:hypothetical protein CASFOL_013874 [Castilleja foliolosa]|uniref:Pentatricopeptide repeat-containing protein n=1 Tax=Castilleja foliolosa TaxID=1961234 RepID=A0ABD3DQ62_9LAMI